MLPIKSGILCKSFAHPCDAFSSQAPSTYLVKRGLGARLGSSGGLQAFVLLPGHGLQILYGYGM